MTKKEISLLEVSPRDGLQNEKNVLSTETKTTLINKAVAAGVTRIEVASFVHPKKVPQMADAEAVIESLPKTNSVTYIGLVLNERGAERALATHIDELGAVIVATDTFGQKNQGQTTQESIAVANAIINRAKAAGRSANVTISVAFGCPFEGEVPADRVVEIAREIAKSEPCEVALADTIGVADPWRVRTLFERVKREIPDMPLRAHFHNTRNTGLANAYAAVEAGATVIDASIGGIGGCPFAPAATGNIPTEDLLYMLQRGGVETGLNLEAIMATSNWLSDQMGRDLPAMVTKAGAFPSSVKAA